MLAWNKLSDFAVTATSANVSIFMFMVNVIKGSILTKTFSYTQT